MKDIHGGFTQGVQTRQMNSRGLNIIPLFAPGFHNAPRANFLKNQIVDKALSYWQSALSVKRPSNRNILIRRDCVNDRLRFFPNQNGTFNVVCEQNCLQSATCHTTQVPPNFLQACRTPGGTSGSDGSGIPGNSYLMIIDASPGGLCNDGCPILGFINFCPNRLDENYPMNRILLSTAIHEMGHALGFNRNLYAFYRDENGRPRTSRDRNTGMPSTPRGEFGIFAPSENVVTEVMRNWRSARTAITRKTAAFVLPNVLNFARNHFNCPNLDGVDLENEGSSATYMTHFEKRVVHDELMAGSVELQSIVSRLTLSVFQDSGWYDVNYEMAQDWKWGRNLGCDFVTKSCSEYLAIQRSRNAPTGPWCDYMDPSRIQCGAHNNAFNYCNMIRMQQRVPPDKQHVTNSGDAEFMAGDSKLHDGCAVLQVKNISIYYKCQNPFMQYYGRNSMCVGHGKERWGQRGDLGASCHEYSCQNGLTIIIGQSSISCPPQGGMVEVNAGGINGFAECPPCKQVCRDATFSLLIIPPHGRLTRPVYPKE
ncbi:hypothetical protein MN116_006202 [Schistosoma mekongi]|uniref:Leishmanolysin-like peptidase n=1 Tax=Schistosoma mekongi TaxID=38744 RepID=A0AAE1ZBD3_SCHME|nr:hypothetical protein MN116_006202 [Schistosoma mekongi]